MTSPVPRYYWDSCAWIGFIKEERDKITPARNIWMLGQKGGCEIYTSAYSYLEVIHGHIEQGEAYSPVADDAKIYAMFDQPHVKRVQLDVEVGKLARELKRKYHPSLSKRPDAIHLASALYHNCIELHTWDKSDLLHLSNKIECRNGRLLPIVIPGEAPVGGMFGGLNENKGQRGPA